ncbi:beta-N-acetylhexosaminidase [Acetobacteraceae bacterium H6797]|nr:beta-N-acetylhexosaminidase [Acetobacteraceae bacterium H6797]
MKATPRALILGVEGHSLTPREIALFRSAPPLGVILFARNIANPAQLRALTASIRELLGAEAPILVDQEGGRVARLKPPHWPVFPPPGQFSDHPDALAAANAALLGAACLAEGLDVVCAPVLDLRLPGYHQIVGDRGLGADPAEVTRLGAAWMTGLQWAGVVPVMKHMPGHGRAMTDSHFELPRVTASRAELAADFAPFAALAGTGAWGMTAHVLYTALDPDRPATLSPRIIAEVIRGEMGFDGLLVSDALEMKALQGLSNDPARACLDAGCDVAMHCTGRIEENEALLASLPPVTERALARLAASRDAIAALRAAPAAAGLADPTHDAVPVQA